MSVDIEQLPQIVIGGAGPAGLTAAYQFARRGYRGIVLEKDAVVGGLSRTVNYEGFCFDIGGHRFFTKSKAVDDMWHDILGPEEFVRRKRISHIYYNNRYFDYPLRPANALFSLGIWNALLVMFSYLRARIQPRRPEISFEDWVVNRFGRRLYATFFKTYTEKVWGIPCGELSAEWAAQRIKGLSLVSALKNSFLRQDGVSRNKVIKTLIDSFEYPVKGPGMMWDRVAERVIGMGSEIRLNTGVARIHWVPGAVTAFETPCGDLVRGTHYISTLPVREFIASMTPSPPENVIAAAGRLNYRDFLTVALIVDEKETFPDNWIYIHDPRVLVGRIQNFKNWSPQMVPDQDKTCLGLEYFCFEGDGLWTMPDAELIDLARRELATLGLVDAASVLNGHVVRMPKAYPVYDGAHTQAMAIVREFLKQVPNLQLVGRNGMHKYNNQDHSMLTAMLAVENIFGAQYDLWRVNSDSEYSEAVTENDQRLEQELAQVLRTQPFVPERLESASGGSGAGGRNA